MEYGRVCAALSYVNRTDRFRKESRLPGCSEERSPHASPHGSASRIIQSSCVTFAFPEIDPPSAVIDKRSLYALIKFSESLTEKRLDSR